MSEQNKPIFDGILTPEARKQTEFALFTSWAINNDLSTQVNDTVTGLTALLYAIKKASIASKLPGNEEGIESYKQQYDAVAYYIEGFVEEFKPVYDEMLDRYVAEKLAGTFDPKTGPSYAGQSVPSINHVYGYANPIRPRGAGWTNKYTTLEE